MGAADSQLNAVLEDAEKLLLQGDYFTAEKCSRKALSSAARLTDPNEKHSFGDRAAAVLLQALFETNRFSNARPSLITAFGSMEKSPPTSLLLWLSLALETEEKFNAQTLMLQLLQAGPCRGASVCRWNHRQYLALIHLYAIEVLLPALRDPSEVRLWLQRQPFLPLDPRERKFLEAEVDAAASPQAENGDTGGGTGNVSGGAGKGQGIEPSGSTDLDHVLGGGRAVGSLRQSFQSSGAAGGGSFDGGRRRVTDYSSMPLPTDQISPMKSQLHGNNDNGNKNLNQSRQSPAVAISADQQQQNPPYSGLSFSPVASNLPFGTLAEYENEQGQHPYHHHNDGHHHGASSSSMSSPCHPRALSPLPSGDLGTTNMPSYSSKQSSNGQIQNGESSFIELDWLGKLQQAAFVAAGTVYSTINDLVVIGNDKISNIQSKSTNSTTTPAERRTNTTTNTNTSDDDGSTTTAAAATTVATVAGLSIFAYAMYTERALIKNSARNAWKGLEDLVKIAFSFTPNPMVSQQ